MQWLNQKFLAVAAAIFRARPQNWLEQHNRRTSDLVVLGLLGFSFLFGLACIGEVMSRLADGPSKGLPPLEGRYVANMRPGTGTIVLRADNTFSQMVHFHDGRVVSRRGTFSRRFDTGEVLFPAFVDPAISGDIFGFGRSVVPAVADVAAEPEATYLVFANDEVYRRQLKAGPG